MERIEGNFFFLPLSPRNKERGEYEKLALHFSGARRIRKRSMISGDSTSTPLLRKRQRSKDESFVLQKELTIPFIGSFARRVILTILAWQVPCLIIFWVFYAFSNTYLSIAVKVVIATVLCPIFILSMWWIVDARVIVKQRKGCVDLSFHSDVIEIHRVSLEGNDRLTAETTKTCFGTTRIDLVYKACNPSIDYPMEMPSDFLSTRYVICYTTNPAVRKRKKEIQEYLSSAGKDFMYES